MAAPARHDRFHGAARAADQRAPFERDRDRILYSSAFRRLVGVTQVVDPSEGQVFHNRLTHTLKVAQIGRRLAQKLASEQPEEAQALGGIEPEVVEAAALAHDLGHPPFGHVAERELDEILGPKEMDGFEGNAQSFRILTKLAFHAKGRPGLNLTRATLNATLKYPWFRQTGGGKKQRKWGAYHTEKDEFTWARELGPENEDRCVEAELMDWADDMTYAVHDLEDFYRAGLVPLDRLAVYPEERERFLEAMFERWSRGGRSVDEKEREELTLAASRLFPIIAIRQPYDGSADRRAALREATSSLIKRYVYGIKLRVPEHDGQGTVETEAGLKSEVRILKELTWQYVIANPSLALQQYGKARVIRDLFETYFDVIEDKNKKWVSILPRHSLELLELPDEDTSSARLAADIVSSLADNEALAVHRKLFGIQPGSVLDLIPS